MSNLYTISINGRTYYLEGNIPETTYEEVESIINSIPIKYGDSGHSEYLEQLINEIYNKLNIKLSIRKIKRVFRVCNWNQF